MSYARRHSTNVCPGNRVRYTISTGDDGRWLLKCHAGCEVDAILQAANLEIRDLFPQNGNGHSARQIVATYDYTTLAGDLLFQVVRSEPKDFRQRRPDGHGGYLWSVKGVNRVVYRLPELQGKPAIFIAEGEKDCDRLASVGLHATTCAGGAEKWRDDYATQLAEAGVKRVAILPDNDEPGRKHAEQVAASCHVVGLEVRIVTLPDVPEKGDVSDYLDRHTTADLLELARDSARYEANSRPVSPTGQVGTDEAHAQRVEAAVNRERANREGRRQVDAEERDRVELPAVTRLDAVLAEPVPPARYRLQDLQPEGSRTLLAAQFKAGKTTLVANLVRSLADGEVFLGRHRVASPAGTVAVLDFEMSPRQLTSWLRDQGIRRPERVVLVSLRGQASSFDICDVETRALWATRLREAGVTYLIVDCLRPILDALGLDENHEAGRFLVALDALMTEADIPDGLVVHHMGHQGERSRGDSRLRDWPDVEWRLVRQDDEPSAPRFFSAYGRDVDAPEQRLAFDPVTRRLTIDGGSPDTRRSPERSWRRSVWC